MKKQPPHTNHGVPRTVDLSEPYFVTDNHDYGYVAHDDKVTWTKSRLIHLGAEERRKKIVLIILTLILVFIMGIVLSVSIWVSFAS